MPAERPRRKFGGMKEVRAPVDRQPHPVALNGPPRNEVAAPPAGTTSQRRWESEARFFDELAARVARELRPMPAPLLARYLEHPRVIYDKEFRFCLLGSLRGQVALDLGCGDGSNAVLLAKRGAYVEGVDVSPRLIEVARRRAELEGVGPRVRFQCAPIERVVFPPGTFDLVWGDGVLHHLVDVLEPTLAQLLRWSKKGALFVFSEPVGDQRWLRRLRAHVPIHTDATADERPLEAHEVALLRRFLPGLRERRFDAFARLTRFVLPVGDYEGAAPLRRRLVDALHALDWAALSVPTLRPLGGMNVMWGRRPAAPS